MQKIVFGGAFAAAFEPLVRPHRQACETAVEPDDSRVPGLLGDVDVLATLAFTESPWSRATSPAWRAASGRPIW